MALKSSPSGEKYRHEKNHRNKHESITDGDRIHRKRQLIIRNPRSKENNRHYIDELTKIETSLQKREKIKNARLLKNHIDTMFF